MGGCRDSEFDQYGDVDSFVTYPEWQKQLSKFGFVQDRLREWRPSVLDKIKLFSCITIKSLDIDGFRIDKGLTVTSDAMGDWSEYIRNCATSVGKTNFFIPGEIVGGNVLGAIYLGRGKEPQMAVSTIEQALTSTNGTDEELYIRNATKGALDGAAFHYSVYRSLCRFLGIDGIYAAEEDTPVDWVDGWADMVQTNDLVNQNTGVFDPRHMFGATNQDVFRWPAIQNGTQKNLLGIYVTTIILPGIPTLMWGEEQANYILENTAQNYLYGRSPMTSSLAWQIHGCYNVGQNKYNNFPLDSCLYGCLDDSVSLDHRDPSHPIRNIIKRMYELRVQYPVLNDGFILQRLSKKTYDLYLPGSGGTPTETGLYSVLRSRADTQDFTGQAQGNQSVWLVYGNDNVTVTYTFDCSNSADALIAPFDAGTTVKNLFYPYEEYTLTPSTEFLGLEGSTNPAGCLAEFELHGYGFKALVPIDQWVGSAPTITEFYPGHDYRILSKVGAGETETIGIQIQFSENMDCDSVTSSISIESNTDDNSIPTIDSSSISCESLTVINNSSYSGGIASAWSISFNLLHVANGVHQLVVTNATSASKNSSTGVVDRFLFRVGQPDNPMVFPRSANYSDTLLYKNENGSYYVSHKAAGATQFRYSVDFQSSYSDWLPYTGGNTTLANKNWTGTSLQAWSGEHVYIQYWGNLSASSDHFQEGDLGTNGVPRRFPHIYVQGAFNQFSYDAGLPGAMQQHPNGTWYYDFMTEWPTAFQLNEWGLNPDGKPDQTLILGDIDHDHILDRIPPGSLITNIINITEGPPSPYTAWRITVNDGDLTYTYIPIGNRWAQLALFVILAFVPIFTAGVVIWIFIKSFYSVKFNQVGVTRKQDIIPLAIRRKFKKGGMTEKAVIPLVDVSRTPTPRNSDPEMGANPLHADFGGSRRCILVATMEYDIEDWGIKIKIGGLGVMAQLMGKALGHTDLIWVVPCVGGIDYPTDQPAEAMFVTILGKEYEIQVQYHVLRNITYVLLDAAIFRKQSKSEPYPPRMDDLESAIYYSAWNQCIAQAISRFDVSIYHINDYHGACAPLYLLPKVIPCALSLHNAEFQGQWPMRTPKETSEVCEVFNLDPAIAAKYVQFGEVFNLLHAGASYLRVHQKGFGAVGVSRKYGKRSFARYPIFWGLSKIGSLPNPDPTDTGEWERNAQDKEEITVDPEYEAKRPELKRQAQEWAGLKQDPAAELFVFVGRWSMQKGIDLIADVFPSILESYPKVQLIAVGPVIDLYGRFAALKLAKMMEL
jgi:alpha-1,3-glucan synthase